MANKGPQVRLGATDSSPRPGDSAVGSPQSRAAARALLERRFAGRIRRTIIVDLETGCTEPRIGEWREGADGSLGRVCALPRGMTMQEAERIVAERRTVHGNATGPNGLCTTVCTTERAIVTKHALGGFPGKGKAC
jgi:hypothetical protein